MGVIHSIKISLTLILTLMANTPRGPSIHCHPWLMYNQPPPWLFPHPKHPFRPIKQHKNNTTTTTQQQQHKNNTTTTTKQKTTTNNPTKKTTMAAMKQTTKQP